MIQVGAFRRANGGLSLPPNARTDRHRLRKQPPATGTVALGDLKIDAPAPTFSAVDLDGKAVTLESMRGQKTVLIEFWAT